MKLFFFILEIFDSWFASVIMQINLLNSACKLQLLMHAAGQIRGGKFYKNKWNHKKVIKFISQSIQNSIYVPIHFCHFFLEDFVVLKITNRSYQCFYVIVWIFTRFVYVVYLITVVWLLSSVSLINMDVFCAFCPVLISCTPMTVWE